jgi:transcriptional regulator with XRE-family HTH domain
VDAGMTSKKLARLSGWSVAESSRIENAITVPSDADIRAWCTACGADGQTDGLTAAKPAGRLQYRRLSRGLQKIRDITFSGLNDEEKQRQREAVLPPSSTNLDVLYFRETVRLYVMQQAYDNLGTPGA